MAAAVAGVAATFVAAPTFAGKFPFPFGVRTAHSVNL